jgi:hypothetical protein
MFPDSGANSFHDGTQGQKLAGMGCWANYTTSYACTAAGKGLARGEDPVEEKEIL